MDNPISRLAPQLFGEYPKPLLKLYDEVSIGQDTEKNNLKERLWKAYEFGNRYHEGQKRLSGEPYFNHCIEVAKTCLLYTSPSPRDATLSRMPSSA